MNKSNRHLILPIYTLYKGFIIISCKLWVPKANKQLIEEDGYFKEMSSGVVRGTHATLQVEGFCLLIMAQTLGLYPTEK